MSTACGARICSKSHFVDVEEEQHLLLLPPAATAGQRKKAPSHLAIFRAGDTAREIIETAGIIFKLASHPPRIHPAKKKRSISDVAASRRRGTEQKKEEDKTGIRHEHQHKARSTPNPTSTIYKPSYASSSITTGHASGEERGAS